MLKSFCFSLLFLFPLCFISEAQSHNYIKNPAIGIHYALFNFNNGVNSTNYPASEKLKQGLAISYLQGISNHFDFSVTLAGSYLDYTLHNGTQIGKGDLLLETDASLIVKMFTDKHLVSFYLTGGLGASKYSSYYGMFFPLGTGLQFNFSGEAYLLLNAQYRFGLTNYVNNHFYYSIGIAGNIKKKSRKKAIAKPALPLAQLNYDRDKDGIPDSLDACPDVPGLQQFNGCPDSDGDGIPDNEDKCPNVPGVLKYHGCPVPDTDGDGINDENDSCPTVPGVIKYHGCPIPDTDGDGINDEEDKCPAISGTKENQGCPVITGTIKKKIELAAKDIFFRTGSYDLLPQSFRSLNDVASLLKSNPSLNLLIEGHTDNVGTSQKNQLLSENRAQAVMDYLVSNGGISKSRLSIKGYGFSKPVATNGTSEGRALNRRVELSLFY